MALTPDGLVVPRYPEVLEEIEILGQQNISPDFIITDDTAVGQYSQIIAEVVAKVYALAEAVNDNFNIDKAEGFNLDDLGALKNVFRLDQTSTQGNIYFTGTSNSTIPTNSIFQDSSGNRFTTLQEYSITKSAAVDIVITVNMLLNSTAYSISVNGDTYTYTSDGSATTSEIINGLWSEIDGDGVAIVEATVDGNSLLVYSPTNTPFTVAHSTNLLTNDVTSVGYVFAEETGPIVVSQDTLDSIVTPVLGLNSVNNREDLIVGRNREDDEDYRIRIKTDTAVGGKATVAAIVANLRNTAGVSYAVVVENDTTVVDGEGRPPKSFEAVVQGGTNLDVAEAIWEVKGHGIETFGTITVAIEDEFEQSQEVKFSRPEQLNVAVRVQYTLYDEEAFPTNGEVIIRTAVLNHINNLGIGVDLIPKRLYGPIYNAVSGIEDLVVEVQEITDVGDPPVTLDWQETSIDISARDFAQVALGDIYIEEV
jgi:uncharacterized phage protein gp47/JayE